jgi:hypothetical protein
MCNKKVSNAYWKDYQGPFFPEELGQVQKYFFGELQRFNSVFLGNIAEAIHAGNKKRSPFTSDHYRWLASISFVHCGVRFRVLIPLNEDFQKVDGTYADRHVALYSKKDASNELLISASKYFVDAFQKVYLGMYESLDLTKI